MIKVGSIANLQTVSCNFKKMRIKLLLKILFIFIIISCHNKNSEVTESFDDSNSIDTTELSSDTVSQIQNLDHKEPEEINVKKGDILFLDYRFGMSKQEIDKTTIDLIRKKKLNKIDNVLYYDLFINGKTLSCKLDLNDRALKYPNKLYSVGFFNEYQPFDPILKPENYDLERVQEVVNINNKNYTAVKKLYVKKYGSPISNIYNFTNGDGDKIIFEFRHKELAKNSLKTHPEAILFKSDANIIVLSSTMYGGFSIDYYSKRIITDDKIEENSKKDRNEKSTYNDI